MRTVQMKGGTTIVRIESCYQEIEIMIGCKGQKDFVLKTRNHEDDNAQWIIRDQFYYLIDAHEALLRTYSRDNNHHDG